LPTKQSCVECHSPKGGVASNCSTCHTFHSAKKELAIGTTDGALELTADTLASGSKSR
jgi:hypothetical protein